ncbi:MAG: histidine kinase N-terminal 7TM domain-containing protein [Opitutales bacterium]|jgi:PAS domain-containing protein
MWLCALLAWSLGIYILAQKKAPEFRAFALTMISVGVYCGGYGGELSVDSLDEMLVWSKVQYFGIATMPLFWIEFVLRYTGRERHFYWPFRAALWTIAVCTICIRLFDERLHLMFETVDAAPSIFSTLDITPGPWYYVQLAYSYLCGLAGVVLLAASGRRQTGLHRRHALLLVGLTVLALVASLLFEARIAFMQSLDLTPFALALAVLIIYVGVVRHNLVELAPVAHDFIVNKLPFAVLVFDKERRLCEANESARALLALGDECIGLGAAQILSEEMALAALPDSGKTSFERPVNGREQEVQTYIIDQENSQRLGWIVVMYDISERKRMERRMEQLLRRPS